MNNVLWYLLGALSGAVIDRYFGRLLDFAERAGRRFWARARADRMQTEFSGQLFRLCGLSAPILVHGFDDRGIPREALVSRLVPDNKPPLEELDDGTRKLYLEARRHWGEQLQAGHIFNGRKLALRDFRPTREAREEETSYRLSFARTDYVEQRAWHSVWRKLGPAGREPFLAEAASRVSPLYSNTFGVSLAVITADGFLLLVRRGMHTAVAPGLFASGCAEGTDERDLHDDTGHPDPYLTAFRGLREELGLRVDPGADAVKIHSLVLHADRYEWGMLGMADLRKIDGESWTRAHIRELWASGKGRDKYEVAALEFIPFKPGPVAAFLREHRDEIEDYALVATIFALLADGFSRRSVASALEAGERPGRFVRRA